MVRDLREASASSLALQFSRSVSSMGHPAFPELGSGSASFGFAWFRANTASTAANSALALFREPYPSAFPNRLNSNGNLWQEKVKSYSVLTMDACFVRFLPGFGSVGSLIHWFRTLHPRERIYSRVLL